jgi:hypothetical protein
MPCFESPKQSIMDSLELPQLSARKLFYLIAIALLNFSATFRAAAQSTIYTTNFGALAVNADPLLAGPPIWNRAGSQAANMQIGTTSASTGGPFFGGFPASASAGANLADGQSAPAVGTGIVTLSGVNTVGFTGITLSYIARKTSAYTGTILLEWSIDGITWTPITFTDVAGSSTWLPINSGTALSLPAGAENQANLRVRWTFTRSNTSGNYRIDDLFIRGTSASPIINVTGSVSGLFTTVGSPSGSASYTVSGSSLSNNLVLTAPAGFEIKTGAGAFASTLTLTPSGGTIASTTIDVRLTGASAGNFSGNITHVSSPATSQNAAVSGSVIAAPVSFTAGNIVALRVGTGSTLTNAATRVLLDEYTPTGTLVQSVSLPTSVSGLNRILTMSGTSTSDGGLTLSPDGQYLSLAGYDAAPGTANVTSSSALLNNRIAALVTQNGSINTTTRISDAYDASNIRSAVTNDGTSFWCAGAGTGGGTRYVTLGNTGTTVQVSGSPANTRYVSIAGSQLFTSSQSGGNIGINTVGSGLPVSSGNSTVVINALPSDPYAYAILDRDPGVAGVDVIYVAGNANGIQKYSFDGVSWTARGTITGTILNLCAKENGANVDIYAISGSAAGNQIYKLTDLAAFNANITGNATALTAAGSLVATTPANTVIRGINFTPVTLPTPDIAHTFSTPGGVGNIAQGDDNVPLYRIQLDVTTANANLTGITLTTAGSYAAADFTNFKLRFSADAILDAGDPTLATITTSSGPGQILNFSGLGQLVPIGTRYLFITTDVSGCATVANSINITSTPLTSITYSMSNKTGTPATGATKTISAGLPQNVTGLSASSGTPQITLSWTNPSCLNDILIVAHTSSITTSPSVNTYTNNLNYASAPAFPGGGRVVYQGSTSPQTITGLTVGTTYFFKVFTRVGSLWSSGIQITGLPQNVVFYSVASGNASTGAIWALTPTGTGQTATALGGFANNKTLRIQNGTQVQIVTSGIPCLDIIIDAGGQLWRNDNNPTNMAYFNVFGNIICNGSIGNGSTFDAVGFNIEAITSSLSGTGICNAGRFRKSANTNVTTTFTVNMNANVRFNGAAIYNNADNTTFNVTIAAGRTVNITDLLGDISIDGTNGASTGDRGGSFTINGTLNVTNKVFALTNNPTRACSYTINSTGILNAGSIDLDITTAAGCAFNLNAGGRLNISKILKVINGTLNSNNLITLVSSGNATGLIDGSGAGNIAGNVLVQRRITGAGGYRYLSSPVQNSFVGSTTNGWADDFPINPSTDGYIYDPTIASVPGNLWPTVWEYNEADPNPNPSYGWVGATSTSDAITPLKGFACIVPANVMVDVFGTVNNGPINYSVTNSSSSGFNLVGNPYPSPISWNAFRSHNANLAASYSAFISSGGYSGTYGTYNGVTGTNGLGNIISSSQGFFITANTTGTIQAINTDRTLDLAPTFFDGWQNPADLLRMEIQGNGYRDEMVVYFDPSASHNFNSDNDAVKMVADMEGVPSVYSLVDGVKTAINVMGAFSQEITIPLGVKTSTAGNFQFSATDFSSFNPTAGIYFEDSQSGQIINLRLQNQVNISLTAGEHHGRFFIRFVPALEIQIIQDPCSENPSEIVISGPAQNGLCLSVEDQNSQLLHTNSTFNGIWNISGLPSGNYRLNLSFPDGYHTEDYFSIIASQLFEFTPSVTNSSPLAGESIAFEANQPGITSVEWDFGDGTHASGLSVSHQYSNSGNYEVVATASNGQCQKVSSIIIEVGELLGINSMNLKFWNIRNINGQIFIEGENTLSAGIALDIFDACGRNVYHTSLSHRNGQTAVTLPNLNQGIYLIRASDGKGVQTIKFIAP